MKRWLIYIGLVVLLGGCSPAARYKIARVIFDGVPSPSSGKMEGKAKSPTGKNQEKPGVPSPKPSSPIFYTHYPYAEGSCDNCHNSQASNQLLAKGNKLCLTCHNDVLTGAKVVHPPAEADCLICHEPHRSKNANLLKQPVEALCFSCHDKKDMEEKHGQIILCTNCHNPHQSKEEYLLKE
ncbi:MAG: hypothetical protein GXO98_03285 [Nitrospirae bacterium]|nr:hypothetical protein [Nitrospirota bacterium]